MNRLAQLQCAAVYKFLTGSVLGENLPAETVPPLALHLAKVNHLLVAVWRQQEKVDAADTIWHERLPLLAQLERETADSIGRIIPYFAEAGLPLLAIKSFLPFPYVDTNLDLVTAKPDQLREYLALLHQLDYRRYRNLADIREPMKQLFQAPGIRLRLHLHTAISWNGVIYLPLDQVWQRRRLLEIDGSGVWIPSSEDELLIMAAHALFENKMVSLHEILYWYHLVTTGLDWSYIRQTALAHGWYPGLIQFLAIMNRLADLLNISVSIALPLPDIQLSSPVWLPYIFPLSQNWRVTGHKLVADLRQGRWSRLPRQLFTYLLVDHLWMYRKAYQKRREVTAVCS